jgi:hypothetical protein
MSHCRLLLLLLGCCRKLASQASDHAARLKGRGRGKGGGGQQRFKERISHTSASAVLVKTYQANLAAACLGAAECAAQGLGVQRVTMLQGRVCYRDERCWWWAQGMMEAIEGQQGASAVSANGVRVCQVCRIATYGHGTYVSANLPAGLDLPASPQWPLSPSHDTHCLLLREPPHGFH